MSGEALPENLSRVMNLSEKQLDFITKNMNPDAHRFYKERRQELADAWNSLLEHLADTEELLDSIKSLLSSTATPEDEEVFHTANTRIEATMAKVRSTKFSKMKTAIAALTLARDEIQGHGNYVREHLNAQRFTSRDFDTEAAIAKAKAVALAESYVIHQQFTSKLTEVQNAIKLELEPGTGAVNLGFASEFTSQINAVRIAIQDIPQTGPNADLEAAQKEIDGYLVQMRGLMERTGSGDGDTVGFAKQLDDVATDPRRPIFVAQEKRRARLAPLFVELDQKLEQMERWDCPQLEATRKSVQDLRTAGDREFQNYNDIDPTRGAAMETAQEGVITEATKLITDAEDIFKAQSIAFDTKRADLRAALIKLEKVMERARPNMSSSQSGPVDAYLAALSTAIKGLNGCNMDALKPAQAMLPVAVDLVRKASDIEAINTKIKGNLETAKEIVKPLSKAPNPLAEEAGELVEAIDELRGSYKEEAINDALANSAKLKEDAQSCKDRNDALVTRRAGIQERIVRREEQLERLNTLFREMYEAMGKPPKDYDGSFRSELEACRQWNASKTNIEFYATIDAKLDSLRTDMLARQDQIQAFKTKMSKPVGPNELGPLDTAQMAGTRYRDAMQHLLEEQRKGKDVSAEIERAKREYQDAAGFLDVYNEMSAELGKIEADAAEELRLNEEYKVAAAEFLDAVKDKLKDSENPLSDYEDEVTPQIDRVKSTLDLVKKGKPGASGRNGLSELGFVEKFLNSVEARGAKTDKDELGKIGAEWRTQVERLRTEAAALVNAIAVFEDSLETSDPDKTSKQVDSALKTLIRRVATNSLSDAGATLANATDKQERKAAREQALSEVRRCRGVLFDDPMFQKCVLNPFGVAFGSGASSRLEEIELNVLRGV